MKRIADYELTRVLGPGNHGTFYLAATPERLGHPEPTVALKILDRHASDGEFKRMVAELRTLLALEHPNLVDIIDAGHDDGRLFYTMPYYADGPLRYGPVDSNEAVIAAVSRVADVAEAAHALHDIGVVHRDIKPSNILLDRGRGLLTDLGVANFISSDFTATGTSAVGSIAFADPTLLEGQPPGRATDIWSLAATLHVALTGRYVMGKIPDHHLSAAIRHVFSAVPMVDGNCPAPLVPIIESAISRDRDERPATALTFAYQLREACNDL